MPIPRLIRSFRVIALPSLPIALILLLGGLLGAPSLTPGILRAASAELHVSVSATSPHVADGIDQSTVTVTVTDATGSPVTDADVILDTSPAMFVKQVAHYVLHLNTTQAARGQYVASFTSVVQGPITIVVTERNTLASDSTVVEFTPGPDPPPAPEGALTVIPPLSNAQGDPPDPKQQCKDFFKTLDDEFYLPILDEKIRGDPNNAELRQRFRDVNAVFGPVLKDIKHEQDRAKAGATRLTKDQTDDLKALATAVKESFQRLSDKQNALLKAFFGNPIDFAKFQDCSEMFNNFELVADFNEAIDRIRQFKAIKDKIAMEKDPNKKLVLEREKFEFAKRGIVVRGPDSTGAHIVWPKFADLLLLIPDLNADTNTLWRNLKPILAKGTAITAAVLTTSGGRKPARLDRTTDDFKKMRKMFDDLRPANTPEKLMALEAKLIELIKDIFVTPGKILAQLPGRDGDRVLVAKVTQADCLNGDEQSLASRVFSAVTLNQVDDEIFGFGADNRGATYVAVGSVLGSQAFFEISGFGLTPGIGPALSTYVGTVDGDSIVGTFEGVADGLLAGHKNTCNWSGNFIMKSRLTCDINGDGQVDRDDINAIFAARGAHVGPGDPRNVTGTGTVSVNDARSCVLRCRNPRCEPGSVDP